MAYITLPRHCLETKVPQQLVIRGLFAGNQSTEMRWRKSEWLQPTYPQVHPN